MWDSDDFVLTRRDTIKRKLSKTISVRSLRTKVWSKFYLPLADLLMIKQKLLKPGFLSLGRWGFYSKCSY